MRAVASILMAYAAVAAAFAAGVKRSSIGAKRKPNQDAVSLPQRLPPSAPPLGSSALVAAAVAAFIAAVLLWPPADGLGMSLVAGTLATSMAATSFVLLEPLLPRALWALAIASPLLAAVCALLG